MLVTEIQPNGYNDCIFRFIVTMTHKYSLNFAVIVINNSNITAIIYKWFLNLNKYQMVGIIFKNVS